MRWIILVATGAWFLLGSPAKDVANWFWPESAAPWETVDAVYYPNRSDLGDFLSQRSLTSVQECRNWAYSIAASRGDPNLIRGDYECGVEQIDSFGGLSVYRLTVR
jgi:hypothetical protein